MNLLKRTAVWIRRLAHSAGFGIQSPWAYQMVRYVINEHWPYYAYEDLANVEGTSEWETLHLCRLYFRMSNYVQASIILDYQPQTDAYARFMKRGNLKSTIKQVGTPDELANEPNIELMRMSLTGDYKKAFYTSLEKVTDTSVIILQDIYRDRETKAFWRDIVADERCTTTFDLYYCGLVFFDKKRYKENYIINF